MVAVNKSSGKRKMHLAYSGHDVFGCELNLKIIYPIVSYLIIVSRGHILHFGLDMTVEHYFLHS